MNCSFEACQKPLSKADMKRRIEYRQLPGGALAFGEGQPGGNLDEATGPLVATFHSKCHFAYLRRQQLAQAKAADPSAQQDRAPDWRDPETVDLEVLAGEGDRGN